MFAQKEALIRLLHDNDPETVRLVKEQLAAAGEERIPELQELMRIDDKCVSEHARDVLAAISGRSAAGSGCRKLDRVMPAGAKTCRST